MTTITTNRIGLDIVDIQVEQTGEPQTDMFFQDPILDQERDYVLGVSELSIPLSSEPMVTDNVFLLNEAIIEFKAKRSAAGAGNMLARGAVASTIADNRARFKLKSRMVVTPVDIIHEMSNFVFTFQQLINSAQGGFHQAGYELAVLASPSGILRFRGNSQFWNDFVLEFSDFGKELLGYDQSLVGLVWTAAMDNPSTQESDIVLGGAFVHSDNLGFIGAYEISLKYSAFRYIENRLRVEVDADLAIPSNILVENGVHKLHYNIASYALPQLYEGRISISNDPVVSTTTSHLTHFYTGNTIVKAKQTPTTDWYKLLSASNVQNMRLHIFIVKRAWDFANKTWKLVRNKLTIAENATWFLTLKFVQQF